MELKIEKKTFRHILLTAVVCIVLFWILTAPSQVGAIFSAIGRISAPFIVGLVIAFIVNVPMRWLESKMTKVKSHKVRRVIAMALSFLLLVAILAGVLTFLSQYLSELQNKTKKEKKLQQKSPQDIQMEKTMRFMRLLLPAMMVIFALTNSASFGLYLIASSLIGIITNFATSFFVNILTRKEEEKYLAWLEKEALHQAKKIQNKKPQMVNYKNISGKM